MVDNDTNWIHYTLSPVKQCLWDGGVHAMALPLWFMVTLLSVKSLSPWFLSYGGYGWMWCGLAGCFFTWVNVIVDFTLHPYYAFNFFPGMFFYGMGHAMRERQYGRNIFLAALAIYSVSLFYPSTVDFRINSIMEGYYSLWLVYASAGIVVFNNIAKATGELWPLTQIGRNSMYWFLCHWIVLAVIVRAIRAVCPNLEGTVLLALTVALVFASLTVLRYVVYHTRTRKLMGI